MKANEAYTLYLETLKELLKKDEPKPEGFIEEDLL